MAEYSDKSLRDKLGLTDDMATMFIHAPGSYMDEIGAYQRHYQDESADMDFIHAFYEEKDQLESGAFMLANALSDKGMLWVSWPKKASGVKTDITEQDLRDIILPLGLVDIKVCSVDDTWSALKFVWRKNSV